ncbi:hypothetical protein LCGC14_0268750 [marine sediment metagenome]|uniref:Uncharacterized protein n=1 Tax=marine sediment metagenome TaxID=412755 RepID=A0A0F9WKE5_9ZZZZ
MLEKPSSRPAGAVYSQSAEGEVSARPYRG